MRWLWLIALTVLPYMAQAAFFPGFPGGGGQPPGTVCWQPNSSTGFTTTCATAITNSGSCGASGTANGTCFVAVANAGSDTCSAYTTAAAAEAAPCKTIAEGIANLRSGQSSDWLLLNRGDTFANQDFTTMSCQYGVSSTAPILISNYGSGARPIVEPASTSTNLFQFEYASCAGGHELGGNNIAVIGIVFYNYTYDPSNGSYTSSSNNISYENLNPITWMLVEDCQFNFISLDIDDTTASPFTANTNVSIRRSSIINNYSNSTTHVSGAYISSTNNLSLYETVFDHGGWNATATPYGGAQGTNHNLYLECDSTGDGCNGPATITGNIFSNDSSGSQFRSGGTVSYNAFLNEPYGHNFLLPYSSASLSSYNVAIGQNDQTANGGSSYSVSVINTQPNQSGYPDNIGVATYDHDIFAHSAQPGTNTNGGALDIDTSQQPGYITNNIACDWKHYSAAPAGVLLWDESGAFTQNGNYQLVADCNHNSYADPNRTVGSYVACLVASGTACSPYSLSGISANATFTGVIASGVLTISGISGTVNPQCGQYVCVGDAVTWSGQTAQDFIESYGTGTGGNGSYNLAGTESVGSGAMSSWSPGQFITAAKNNNNEAGWNPGLTACALAKYIGSGFGLTNPCTP